MAIMLKLFFAKDKSKEDMEKYEDALDKQDQKIRDKALKSKDPKVKEAFEKSIRINKQVKDIAKRFQNDKDATITEEEKDVLSKLPTERLKEITGGKELKDIQVKSEKVDDKKN